MFEQPITKRRIKLAYSDMPAIYIGNILRVVNDLYDFEITRDRDADYVFFSCDGLDVLRYPGIRIFVCGENVTPNFAICDYAMAFDKMQFGDRNLWSPLFKIHSRYHDMLKPRPDPLAVMASKTDFCAYVMSNTTASDDMRIRIFDALSAYKTVHSGGRWRNNVGGPVSDKLAFQRSHKFVIACENCSYPGYLTEKFLDAALSDAIPIYWGDPDIANYLNPKAFINCHDYGSLAEIVDKVREIDQDDSLYAQMLSEPWFVDNKEPECLKDETFRAFICNIFDQDPKKACRRSRGRWGVKNEQRLYDMCHRPHVQFFMNLRKAWRRFYRKLAPRR